MMTAVVKEITYQCTTNMLSLCVQVTMVFQGHGRLLQAEQWIRCQYFCDGRSFYSNILKNVQSHSRYLEIISVIRKYSILFSESFVMYPTIFCCQAEPDLFLLDRNVNAQYYHLQLLLYYYCYINEQTITGLIVPLTLFQQMRQTYLVRYKANRVNDTVNGRVA